MVPLICKWIITESVSEPSLQISSCSRPKLRSPINKMATSMIIRCIPKLMMSTFLQRIPLQCPFQIQMVGARGRFRPNEFFEATDSQVCGSTGKDLRDCRAVFLKSAGFASDFVRSLGPRKSSMLAVVAANTFAQPAFRSTDFSRSVPNVCYIEVRSKLNRRKTLT